MIPAVIAGATEFLGAPANWDPKESGPCGVLPVRREVVDGTVWLVSAWDPTPEEREMIAQGGKVELRLSVAQHPVTALGASPPPP